MTRFLLLHTGVAAAPGAELDGELLEAGRLADQSLAVLVDGLAVLVGGVVTPVTGYWLLDVESLERAVQIAALAGGPVEVRQVMSAGSAADQLP